MRGIMVYVQWPVFLLRKGRTMQTRSAEVGLHFVESNGLVSLGYPSISGVRCEGLRPSSRLILQAKGEGRRRTKEEGGTNLNLNLHGQLHGWNGILQTPKECPDLLSVEC